VKNDEIEKGKEKKKCAIDFVKKKKKKRNTRDRVISVFIHASR